MTTLRTALIQLAFCPDRDTNTANCLAAIRHAAGQGARLVVLPELHNSLYFCQSEDPAQCSLAEPIPGPLTDLFAAAARDNRVVLVGSFFERRTAGLYHNTAVVFETDGSLAGRYRKMHIPDDPAYYEKFYFTPGDLGFHAIPTSVGKLGVLVCWDQWYPEAARLMALDGAQILIYPTAIGWDPADGDGEKQRQLEAWTTIQRSHAIANGIPVLSVNRTGFEPAPSGRGGIEFWGHTFAAGCQGEMLSRAGQDQPETLLADIDLDRTESVRRIWPFLRDRRIDAYGDLTRRFRDTPSGISSTGNSPA
ncbi:MAG: carbon-nitrogen hydrolase [bacterium]